MSIVVESGMTKTIVLDLFRQSTAKETIIEASIDYASVASFAVDVLRRKGHAVRTEFLHKDGGDRVRFFVETIPRMMDRIVKSTVDVKQLYQSIEKNTDVTTVNLHACGTAISRSYEILVYAQSKGWTFKESRLGSVPVSVATTDGAAKILWKTTSVVVMTRSLPNKESNS